MPSFPLGAHRAAPLLRPRLTALALAAAFPVAALAADPPAASTVTITGNPLGSSTLAQPSNVLTGQALSVRRSGTLGETLDGDRKSVV